MTKHVLRAVAGVSALLVASHAQAMEQIQDQIYLDDGSSVYYPDPYVAQQANSELTYETVPNCYGYCYGGTEAGDPDAIGFKDQGDAADASNTTEPAGAQTTPSTAPVFSFTKAFHKDQSFGNGTFASGYALDASLTAYSASAGVGAQFQAVGEGKLWARAFGYTQEVVRGKATGTAQQGGAVGAKIEVYAMGQQVYLKNLGTAGPVSDTPLFNRTFFNAEKTIPVMGYPVKVTAKLTGNAGISVVGTLVESGIKLTATPKGGVYATASAGVDFVIVSLTVTGTLTLIEAQLPANLQLVASSCSTLDWKLTADYTLTSLSGNLKVALKIKLWIIKIKGSLTIAKWNGYTSTVNLFTATSQNPLTLSCQNGQPVGGAGTISGNETGGTGGTGGGGGGGGWGGCFTSTDSNSLQMVEACN
ncbi:hypothetical protein [Pyxidicoccus caerfyrddinensis]|uniref:hypothetical protein n=1 Tax=Pyxidicoccus caerfyrddinensis TaxID=2709663 RepID=UPI0013DC2AE7|nr:hypothetical protein [Pyxidicoccus caerfyrddinensis]